MGERASEFCHANAEPGAGYTALVAQLDDLLGESKRLGSQQQEGIAIRRGATVLKRQLEAEIRRTHLGHVARVAAVAAQERPEMRPALRIPRDTRSTRVFQTAASTIAAAAQANRELLVKHGLAEPVLDDLVAMLQRYDQAVMQGVVGRRQHIGATADLDVVADEIMQVVQLLDGYQRLRFARDPERLPAWASASSVVARRQTAEAQSGESTGGTTPAPAPAGDVRPAA